MRKHEERKCLRTLLPSVVLIETSYISATTALQRKLIVGALDFSPLRHSPALAERHYYTTKPPEWSGEILANLDRGKSAAVEASKDRLGPIRVS